MARGVSGEIVAAANLIFAEFQGPTELGLPMVTRRDMVSIMAAKAYAKTAPVGMGFTAGLIPVWNLKHQSDSGIVPPFKVCSQCSVNGYSGHGVAISAHTSLPIEASITVTKGELDIELRAPQQMQPRNGQNHELLHLLVTPYTVRAPWATAVPLNKAQDAKQILSGSPVKRVNILFLL